MAPYDSHFLIFMASVIPSSWIRAKPSDSLVTNKLFDYHFILLALSCSPACSIWWKPAATLYVTLWRDPYGKELREAAGQQLVKYWHLSPTACKQLNPTNHVSESENGSVLRLFFRWDHSPGNILTAALWESLRLRHPVKPCSDSWVTETVR